MCLNYILCDCTNISDLGTLINFSADFMQGLWEDLPEEGGGEDDVDW